MAIKTERLQLRVDIDTAEGVRNLTALQEKYDLIIQKNKEAKGDEKSTTAKQALEAKAALDKEREAMGLVGLTLKELKNYQRELNNEKNRYNEGTDQYNKANTNLNIVKNRINELTSTQHSYNQELLQTVKTQGIEGTSLTHLREYYKLLQKEIQDTSEFESEANKKRIADAQQTKALIDKKDGEVTGTTSFFGQIKEQMPSAVAGAFGGMFVGLAGMAAEVIGGAFASGIDAVKKRARDITDIEVSLNTTRANATKIRGELNDIKTESSVDDLKKLVVAAGDLNVAEADIKSFVTEADKIGVVMSSDFGGSVEEAVTMIAKLKGEFKKTREMNFPDAIAKIGSTLKQLNLDGPASTQGITDFLKRVGAIPDAIKPTLPQLASFGAVYEEANLSAEISGSGFTKILTVAANNAALFGKQMGMTKKEIENLINTDPNQFVIKFAESLKGLSGTDTAKSLKAVKLESDEVFKVVGILTDNIGKLTEKQKSANQTFKEGTLTTEIFNKYLDDEAGKISQIGKAWSRVGASVVNVLAKISGPTILWLANMSEKGKSVEDTFAEQSKKSAKLESTLPGLITKYQELSRDSNLSAEGQRELNKVIGEIGQVVPGAITEFDKFGRAMSVNLGLVNEFVKKQKQASTVARDELADSRRKEMADNTKHIKLIQEQLKTGKINDYEIGIYTKTIKPRPITDAEIRKNQADLAMYQKKNKEAYDDYKLLYSNAPISPTKTATDQPPKTDGNIPVDQGAADKQKAAREKAQREADARQKYLDESTKQMLDLQAKLAFEELQATADAEEKRINVVNKNAEDELKRIETQFKNQKGVVLKQSQLSQEQKDLIQRERLQIERKQEAEAVAITDEFAQKRAAQIQEQTNRAIQIAQDGRKNSLDNTLKTATKNGDNLGVFNAKYDIIGANESQDLSSLDAKFLKEKIALKDNKEALLLLEKNYGDERERITAKAIADRALLIQETNKNELDTAKKENLKKLGLDVTEAKQNGKDPKQAELALLDGQMAQELSVVGLTEEAKTNIVRDYALKRRAIEKEGAERTAETALEYFGKAFNAIGNIAKTIVQNRSIDEEQHYNDNVRRIDQQAERGILTARQQTKQKMALDKEHDKAQRKIKLEQFNLDKAANMANIVIQTALAVMKASPNVPLMVVTGVLGAIELGIAAAQKPPAYKKGGRMPKNFQNPVDADGGGTIIAHPNEFMLNAEQANTPEGSRFVDVFDKRQKNGITGPLSPDEIKYINPSWMQTQPVYANIQPVIDYQRSQSSTFGNSSSFSSPSSTAPQQGNSSNDMQVMMSKFLDVFGEHIESFGQKLDKPLTAHAAIGEEEIFKMEQERNKLTQKLDQTYGTINKSLIQ